MMNRTPCPRPPPPGPSRTSQSSAPWWQRTARVRGRWRARLCLLRSRSFPPNRRLLCGAKLRESAPSCRLLTPSNVSVALTHAQPSIHPLCGDSPGSYSPNVVEDEFYDVRQHTLCPSVHLQEKYQKYSIWGFRRPHLGSML